MLLRNVGGWTCNGLLWSLLDKLINWATTVWASRLCLCYLDALLMNVTICMHPFHKLKYVLFFLQCFLPYGVYVLCRCGRACWHGWAVSKASSKRPVLAWKVSCTRTVGKLSAKAHTGTPSRCYYIPSCCYISSFMENYIKSLLTCWVIYYHTPMTMSLLYLTQSLLLFSVLLVICGKLTDILVKYPTS